MSAISKPQLNSCGGSVAESCEIRKFNNGRTYQRLRRWRVRNGSTLWRLKARRLGPKEARRRVDCASCSRPPPTYHDMGSPRNLPLENDSNIPSDYRPSATEHGIHTHAVHKKSHQDDMICVALENFLAASNTLVYPASSGRHCGL